MIRGREKDGDILFKNDLIDNRIIEVLRSLSGMPGSIMAIPFDRYDRISDFYRLFSTICCQEIEKMMKDHLN